MGLDPVCEMDVEEATRWRSEFQGQTCHFCGPGCTRRFDGEPERYLARR